MHITFCGFLGLTLLLVVAGSPNPYDVEILDMTGNKRTCPKMENVPVTSEDGLVGTYMARKVLICGGETQFVPTNKCYSAVNQVDFFFINSQIKL